MTTVPTKDPGSVFQTTILEPLAKSWWLMLLRGIVAIVFGVLAFVWPGVTLFTLVLFYGAYALVDGAFAIGEAVAGPGTAGPRWWMAVNRRARRGSRPVDIPLAGHHCDRSTLLHCRLGDRYRCVRDHRGHQAAQRDRQ